MARAPAKRSRGKRAPAAPACASVAGADSAALAADIGQLEVRHRLAHRRVAADCQVPDVEGVGSSHTGLRISKGLDPFPQFHVTLTWKATPLTQVQAFFVLVEACASRHGGRPWASRRQKHARRWQTRATTWQRRPSGSSATACERAVQVGGMRQQQPALAHCCLYQLLDTYCPKTHGFNGGPDLYICRR